MKVIKNKKVLALVGICCLILGVFLPYFTITIWGYSESYSLWSYWEGKVILILTLANALFIFGDFIEKRVPQLFNNSVGKLVKKANNPKFSLVPTILTVLLLIYMLVEIGTDYSEFLKYGLGFWMNWIGIAALIGHAIFYKKPEVQSQSLEQQTINY